VYICYFSRELLYARVPLNVANHSSVDSVEIITLRIDATVFQTDITPIKDVDMVRVTYATCLQMKAIVVAVDMSL